MADAAPILIAGSGIGGLALALALAKHGRRSVVLEAREALATEGAGIQLGPNGVHALRHLGVADALQPAVGTPDALEVRDGSSGHTLVTLPLGRWIAERHGAPYWATHRGDLHAALLHAAVAQSAIALRTGYALTDLIESGTTIEATSAAGARIAGGAIVGADGLWSRVRGFVCPPAQPQFVGSTATRTVMPAAEAGALACSNIGLWLGPGANVVHYPVRGGAEVAVVVISVEAWQGKDWDAAADRSTLMARLSQFHATLTEPLRAAPFWRKWALHRLAPLPRWSTGRITLLGDAAHPMLPHLAQGGVLALEDAVVLADCLAADPADEPRAFLAYEAQRRRRAARVQAASRWNGRVYQLGPPFAWARNAALRLVPRARLMAGYDWLYGWRPGAGVGD
jgi:salicylate hydroxylase